MAKSAVFALYLLSLLCSMDRDAKWLAWFEHQFSMVAGSDRQIDLQEFKKSLNVKEVGSRVWHYIISLESGHRSNTLQKSSTATTFTMCVHLKLRYP